MRKESPSQDQVVHVAIDQHSQFSNEAPIQEEALIEGAEGEKDPGNPCSYLGCNSHKCAWASGGAITRVSAKKACSNAQTIGSGADTNTAATSLQSIVTL